MSLSTILITTFLSLGFAWLFSKWRKESNPAFPKGYKKLRYPPASPRKNTPITRDRYQTRKIPEKVDAIVIGSGIGGLSTAALLARNGWQVLVLEQHYIAGGTTHTFSDHGYEFETGIHYIGNIKARNKILNLMTDKPIEWTQQGYENNDPDKMIYDEIVLGEGENERTYLLRAGKENFIQDLVDKFPEEETTIRHYVELVERVCHKDTFFLCKVLQSSWLRQLAEKWLLDPEFVKYSQMTVTQVLNELTDNKELIAVLSGQFGDYGLPGESSFFMHASVVNHYLDGGFYPVEGSEVFANRLIPTIEKSGGRVLVDKAVECILTEPGVNGFHNLWGLLGAPRDQAVGIKMVNGDEIRAPVIISSAGYRNTYGKLLPERYRPKNYDSLLKSIPASTSFCFLFVGIKEDPEKLGIRSSNIWVYPDTDYDGLLENFSKDPYNAPMPLFIASAAVKEGTSWSQRHPGKTSLVVLTLGKKEWFEQWADEKCTKRSKDYKELKEKLAERMFEGLYRFYPQLKGKVDFYEVGTPLSIQHYIASAEGEGYGFSCVPARFTSEYNVTPQTTVDNLYLAGQDVGTLGFTGAMMGGLLCAHQVLGYGTLSDIFFKRDLIKELPKAHQNQEMQNIVDEF